MKPSPPSRQAPVVIGLEVDRAHVRAVCRLHRAGGHTQWRYAQAPRSGGALADDLARLLRPWRRWRLRAHVVLAAPEGTVRLVTVTSPDPRGAAQALQQQLPALLPFETARVQIRFQVRRQQRVDGRYESLFAVAACERQSLQEAVEALWRAGWPVAGVAPAGLALAGAAQALGALAGPTAMLLDVGGRRSTLVSLEGEELAYARDVPLGVDHLRDALMGGVSAGHQQVQLSRPEADAVLQQAGIPALETPAAELRGMPAPTYLALVQPILEQLAEEVRRTMTFASRTTTATAPTRLLLSGEGLRLPGFERWLGRQLGVPVERLSAAPLVGADGEAAALVCGLAARPQDGALNLTPPTAQQRRQALRGLAMGWRLLAVAAGLVWLLTARVQQDAQAAAHHRRQVAAAWAERQPVVALRAALAAQDETERGLLGPSPVTVEWLHRLSEGFPDPVRLSQLTLGERQRVDMVGEAQAREQAAEAYVSELALWLEQGGLCRGVRQDSSRRTQGQEQLVGFGLTCQRP
jgi:Tfp pilus assembly PilM family ATPase